MRGKNTIYIKGRHYDAATGLAVDEAPKPKKVISEIATQPTPVKTIAVHPAVKRAAPHLTKIRPQRSTTLHRMALKKPVGSHDLLTVREKRTPHLAVRSEYISKFAPHPQPRMESVLAPHPVKHAPQMSSVIRTTQHAAHAKHQVVQRNAVAPKSSREME